MIDFMETLLQAWGQAQVCPQVEVSISSPLAAVGGGGRGVGGHRCLSLVESWVVQGREVLAVEQALRDLAGSGTPGRLLAMLAEVRYARRPGLPLDQQRRLLGISRNTYRARVDQLHVEVAARLPAIVAQLLRLEAGTDAAQARHAWLERVRKATARLRKEQVREGRARRVGAAGGSAA